MVVAVLNPMVQGGGVLWGPVTSMQKPEGGDTGFGHQDGIRPGVEEEGVRMDGGQVPGRNGQEAVPASGLWRPDRREI